MVKWDGVNSEARLRRSDVGIDCVCFVGRLCSVHLCLIVCSA